MVLIDATHINVGGGKALLIELLKGFRNVEDEIFLILDKRINQQHLPVIDKCRIIYCEGTIILRTLLIFKLNSGYRVKNSCVFINPI
jgi:hypothetical protein